MKTLFSNHWSTTIFWTAILTISLLCPARLRADVVVGQTVDISHTFTNKTLKVALVTLNPDVSNPSFLKINDPNAGVVAAGFTAPAANTIFKIPPRKVLRTVRFSGAKLPAKAVDTVDFNFDRPFGPPKPGVSIPITFEVKMTVFDPPQLITLRANSEAGDVFSKCVEGGASGNTFIGIPVPAGQYGYFYEFESTNSVDTFSVQIAGSAPSSMGVDLNTWSSSTLSSDLGPEVELGNGPVSITNLTDSMEESNLTQVIGAVPFSWSYVNGAMVATSFDAGVVAPGSPSAILWFISSTPPDLGGPLGEDGTNVVLSLGGQIVSSGGAVAPAPACSPQLSPPVVLGSQVILSGSGGTLGGSYSVLSSTNLLAPLASWTTLSTSFFDASGNFTCTNTLAPGGGQQFFSISCPN